MTEHPVCEDPSCLICQERLRLATLDIERKLRPAGSLLRAAAKVKARARRLRGRGQP